MGYVTVHSPCIGCNRLFSYNPHKVPSIRLNADRTAYDEHGERHPICQSCVDRINPQRIANGVPPIEVLPDAYEPMAEGEL